jgi:hypothetical protein
LDKTEIRRTFRMGSHIIKVITPFHPVLYRWIFPLPPRGAPLPVACFSHLFRPLVARFIRWRNPPHLLFWNGVVRIAPLARSPSSATDPPSVSHARSNGSAPAIDPGSRPNPLIYVRYLLGRSNPQNVCQKIQNFTNSKRPASASVHAARVRTADRSTHPSRRGQSVSAAPDRVRCHCPFAPQMRATNPGRRCALPPA